MQAPFSKTKKSKVVAEGKISIASFSPLSANIAVPSPPKSSVIFKKADTLVNESTNANLPTIENSLNFDSYEVPSPSQLQATPAQLIEQSKDILGDLEIDSDKQSLSPPTLESDKILNSQYEERFRSDDDIKADFSIDANQQKISKDDDASTLVGLIEKMNISTKKTTLNQKIGVPIRGQSEGSNITVLTPVKASKSHKKSKD